MKESVVEEPAVEQDEKTSTVVPDSLEVELSEENLAAGSTVDENTVLENTTADDEPGAEEVSDGWHFMEGKWYWYQGGTPVTGWIRQNTRWFYLGENGEMKTGWGYIKGKWYYFNQNGVMQTGWLKVGVYWYYLEASGVMTTGWKYIGGYKYYFYNGGNLAQDLTGIIGSTSQYYISVNRAKCQIMVYTKDGYGNYVVPVKTFACSVGLPSTPTPTGTYQIPNKFRWLTLLGPSYGQYCSQISGDYLFHSVPGNSKDSSRTKLGSDRSESIKKQAVWRH